jgi:acyl-CoA synthetase (AMP-forming)/AMP-acid ligase II
MQAYLTQPLHRAVLQCPGREALVFGQTRMSYATFVERVARLGSALRGLGMEPGARIGMLALGSHRFVEFYFGVWWGGGVVNPVNMRWTAKDVAYSLDDCDTRVLIIDDPFVPMLPALRSLSRSLQTVVYAGEGEAPEGTLHYESLLAASKPMHDCLRQGDDLAAVMYTGGTTGLPKGVMLSHAQLSCSTLAGLISIPRPSSVTVRSRADDSAASTVRSRADDSAASTVRSRADDSAASTVRSRADDSAASTALLAAPLFHIGGCALMLHAAFSHQRMVVLPVFDDLAVIESIHTERVSELFLVPTMLKRVIEHPRLAAYDTSCLRRLIYGAAPIDGALLDRALQAFPEAGFYQAYGMTECAPLITILQAHAHLPDAAPSARKSAGQTVVQAELRIVDADDRDLPQGSVGEVIVRGPMVMLGYWNKPDETAQALRGGWMHTGDGGYVDADGYLHVVDRIKDMIITGGENVYSVEVENVLSLHPDVFMAAVLGVPDADLGERVHAVVVLRPGAHASEQDLIQHCRSQLASYKSPRAVEFQAELPLSAAGKLLKYQLRERYWRGRESRVS